LTPDPELAGKDPKKRLFVVERSATDQLGRGIRTTYCH